MNGPHCTSVGQQWSIQQDRPGVTTQGGSNNDTRLMGHNSLSGVEGSITITCLHNLHHFHNIHFCQAFFFNSLFLLGMPRSENKLSVYKASPAPPRRYYNPRRIRMPIEVEESSVYLSSPSSMWASFSWESIRRVEKGYIDLSVERIETW